MRRYCEVRLVNSVTAENIIKQVGNKKKSNIDYNISIPQKPKNIKQIKKNPVNMVYSLTNKLGRINKNKGISCSAEYLPPQQRKVTRNSIILQTNNEQNKKTVDPSQCIIQIESSNLTKNNDCHFNPISHTTRKRQSLEGNTLNHRKKFTANTLIEDVAQSSKQAKQNKLKKKRNAHIIIWESKLTGAQRVSKRLSNLRTKNRSTEKVESFNLFPVTIIKKHPVKIGIPNKMKRAKNSRKDKNKAKQILFFHKDQSEISDSKTCTNANFVVEEVKCETVTTTCAKSPKEKEIYSSVKVEEEMVIQNSESINLQKEESINKNDISDNIEVLQEDCLADSNIIIVELEPVGNGLVEWPKEKTVGANSCESKQECHSNVKEDVANTGGEQSSPKLNELILTDKINEEAYDKKLENTLEISKTDNVSVSTEMKLDQNIQTFSIEHPKN